MTLVNQLILLTTALWNLFFRVLYLPAAIFAWLITLLQQWRAILALILVGAAFFVVAQYGGTVANEVEFAFRCRINPYYNDSVRPILSGIIRQYFNNIVCWYNGIVWFPYGWGREVIFPILREGGFGATVLAFGRFLNQIGQDVFIGYVATGNMFSQELDLSRVCTAWQTFWASWQGLWCFGCNDLCPYFTKLPMIPAFWTSDQYGDDAWWCFMSNMINGWIVLIQRVIYIIREIIWPTQPVRPRFEFKRSFDLFCAASTCFWKSWENAMQKVWDNFVPYKLAWVDLLCFFDKVTCAWIRFAYLLLNMTVNYDQVFNHFAARSSDFWINQVKEDFKEIINTIGRASYFDPIIVPLPPGMGNMSITHYRLDPLIQAKPNGDPNPLFNQTNAGDCLCLAITRLLCDPQNNGTTCAQQFNGTLLATVDPCCLGTELGTTVADISSSIFEITLHLKGTNDFVLFLDRQPFTGLIKQGLVRINACIAQIFLAVQTYGGCLSVIVAEIGDFIICSSELVIRIVLALITLPYFDAFLPGYCNFITCPGDNALSQTLGFLDKLSNETNPNGLINCMCFTLNSAFNVPFAGCGNVTCKPTGFIDPETGIQQRRRVTGEPGYTSYTFSDSFYNLTSYSGIYSHRLTPIMTYNGAIPNSFQFSTKLESYSNAKYAMKDAFNVLDQRLAKFGEDWKCGIREAGSTQCPLRSSPRLVPLNITNVIVNCTDPLNPTPNPPPCFNLCCLPKKVTQLFFHTIAFSARAINAGFQARFSVNGSDYWSGDACMQGRDCFQSDATMFVTKAIAPIECLCEFIKLVLPPQGFADPCCGFNLAAELISCTIQVIINIGNSIGGDSPNFTYIRDPKFFLRDFDTLLEISLKLFDCCCNFIRSIFAVAFKSNAIEKGFDPCCTFRIWFRVILELLRLLVRVTFVLSTLDEEDSQCYIYVNGYGNARPKCVFAVGDLPIVQQFRNITTLLLAPPITQEAIHMCAATLDLKEQDPDKEGLPTCVCRLANALLAMVNKITSLFVGDLGVIPQCKINLCCPIYNYGRVYKELIDLIAQAVATVWQNWEYKEIVVDSRIGIEKFFIPQETINFLFCDEYGSLPTTNNGMEPNPVFYNLPGYNPIQNNTPAGGINYNPNPNATIGIVNANGVYDPNNPTLMEKKCGKIEPALKAIQNLIGGCLCASGNTDNMSPYTTCGLNNANANGIANILDALARWLIAFVTFNSAIFPIPLRWPSCLCCGGPNPADPGMVRPFADLATTILRQGISLIRNLPNPTYWAGEGGTITNTQFTTTSLADNFDDLRNTWINRAVAPVADAACRFITNSGCLLAMVLGETCEPERYAILSSVVRYYFEAIIRAASLIEGAVKLFSQEQPGQCVGGPNANNVGNTFRPEDQGTTGQTGQLVPTCSPQGQDEKLQNRVSTNQIGRILVSVATFVVDALIGVSRFGCSEICPGIKGTNPTQNLASSTTCSCWNLSPYFGLQGLGGNVCGFDACDCVYNSGLGNFKCPNGAQECTPDVIRTGFDPTGVFDVPLTLEPYITPGPNVTHPYCPSTIPVTVSATGVLGLFGSVQAFTCEGGCSNDTNVVGRAEQVFLSPNPAGWETLYPAYKFRPMLDPTGTQPSGLICAITGAGSPAKKNHERVEVIDVMVVDPIQYTPPTYGSDFLTDAKAVSDAQRFGRRIRKIVPSGTPPFPTELCYTPTPTYNPSSAEGTNYEGACWALQTCGTGSSNPLILQACNSAQILTYASPELLFFYNRFGIDPIPFLLQTYPDLRSVSVMQWQCQTCLLSANAKKRGDLAEPYFQPICEKIDTCIGNSMCKNDQLVPCTADNPDILDGVIIVILKYIACLMQDLFGNFPTIIFKWLLIFLSFIWQISGGVIRFLVAIVILLLNLVLGLANPVAAFFNSIPQILKVFSYFFQIFNTNVVWGYRSHNQGPYQFNDGHDCIEHPDPVYCFCKTLDFSPTCQYIKHLDKVVPENITTPSMMMYLSQKFSGETSCDMLFSHIVRMNIVNWLDLSYEQRFQAVDCVTKRAQGEYWAKTASFLPKDIFYNPMGVSNMIYSLLKASPQHFRRGPTKGPREPTAVRFKKRFRMDEEVFLKSINTRGRMVKEYYMKEHGMTESSMVMDSMLKLDMYWYKYQFGFYGFLLENPSEGSIFGSYSENLGELFEATQQLSQDFSRGLIEPVRENFQKNGEFFKRMMPPVPEIVRVLMHPEFWKQSRQFMSNSFEFSRGIRFNPPTLESVSLWPQQVWTKHVARNLDTGMRLIYGGLHHIWPQYTTKENHDRFILGGNCRIVDGTVKLGTEVVDYCLNEFRENIPALRQSPVGRYLENTSHLRHGSFFNKYRGKLTWNTSGSGEWKRPKIDYIPLEARTMVHRHMYQRAVPSESLIGKLLVWFFGLFGIDAKQTIDNFLLDFRDWVSNPSTSIQDYPNVGARYWATFFFRCEWPENINCSIGIGLGEALWKVGVVFLIVILILVFTFPQALSIISGIIIFLIYVITVAIVAWHYSPACLSLFPAIIQDNQYSVPVLPIPLNGIFPLIPECLWDDVIHVLDSVFAACYTWIPAGWLNGPQCPTCDARIGLPNCVDVGVSTPLEVLVYWGYQIMGMLWCDIMRGLSTTIIFSWIPGFTSGVDTTCTLLATASPSQLDRMRLCGYLASGTLAWFAIGFWALGLFIIAVIGPLLNIGHGFLLLLPTLPHYDALVGVGEAQGSFVMDGEDAQGEEEEEEETPVKFVPQRRGISDYMASLIRRTVLPHSKTE